MAKEGGDYKIHMILPDFWNCEKTAFGIMAHNFFSSSRMFIDVGSPRWKLMRRGEAMGSGIPETMVFRKISI